MLTAGDFIDVIRRAREADEEPEKIVRMMIVLAVGLAMNKGGARMKRDEVLLMTEEIILDEAKRHES